MSYITHSMLEQRVGSAAYAQLADDNGDGVADVEVVDEIRQAAEGEVNSYLAARYAVPVDLAAFSELSGLLVSITLDVAEYRLRLRRPPVSMEVLRRRAEAVDWLANIAAGVLALPADGVPTNAGRGITAEAIGNARILSHDELTNH